MSRSEKPVLSTPLRVCLQQEQVLAARVGKRLQHDGVDDAEDGGVGADAERHRDDDGERIAGLLAQAAHAVANVLRRRFRPGASARCRARRP